MAMDQRELDSCVKQLAKLVSNNDPASSILAVLDRLKKEASPTEDMLRSTRAGVGVGKLRANPNKEIARAATELVHKWKKLVEAEKQGKLKKSSPAAPSPTTAAAPKPVSNSLREPFKGDPEKRKAQPDGADCNRTGDEVRDRCIELLYNGLAYRSRASVTDVMVKAVAIEHAAFKQYNGGTPEYKEKVRSLFSNLKNKTNPELGRNVLDGKIAPERFVVMTHEELKSAEQRKKENALQEENMKKAQVPMAEKSISDALKCGKCGQKKVSYSQAQTRSADEPMTTFCECTVCGNRWKFS
ncbi:Transcription elongation factor S-II [Colletotrichum sidae]|uniref:Transcription elongation factor n=4 Tax=Colletotrichum orbiculare species complex TaxID=2707354 RepID=N4V4P7_COLOR|nr:Transcription elongation factor S-II [Colletotrichum orbiculare MAFF 240422]TDZ40282.1 Transcription elongation factor S-II [Colletotrichum spinosum]TDZ66103.1 Transcription elongation factor S-II [Colletotrichum trifolii]TEA22467.1 Transcription elongation factor S-II [Colletotrichum sidae]